MRSSTFLSLAPVLLAWGCGGPSVTATAEVTEHVVAVTVTGPAGAQLTLDGMPLELVEGRATAHLSLDRFTPGPNELVVSGRADGKDVRAAVTFTVPPGHDGPFLLAHGCGAVQQASLRATIDGDLGHLAGCPVVEPMRIVVHGTTNRRTTVLTGRTSQFADENGRIALTFDLRPFVGDARVGEDASGRPLTLTVPVVVQRGEPPLGRTVTVTADEGALVDRLFASYVAKTPLFEGASPDGSLIAYLRDEAPAELSGAGKVRDVRWVVIGHTTGVRRGPDCGPYDFGSGPVSAVRLEHDVFAHVYDARTGAERARGIMSSKEPPCPTSGQGLDARNPAVHIHPPFAAVKAFVEQLEAEDRGAPKPPRMRNGPSPGTPAPAVSGDAKSRTPPPAK